MHSIIIIIPYFGQLPPMFKFWRQSALNNPTIDFLLRTDSDIETSGNVKVRHCTFEECKNRIQLLFDFPVSLPAPYKLCDYKPVYHNVFIDEVAKYDFWGFGDLDLVYGDIRHFFTPEVLDRYSVISGWGHLTLYRNCELCNNFYKKEISGFQYYKNVYTNPQNSAFDEYNHKGMSDMWTQLYPEQIWNSKLFDDIQVPRLSLNFVSVMHPERTNLIFEYNENRLYRIYHDENGKRRREETLYAHFQQRKFMKIETNNLQHYLIVPNKFIDFENIDEKRLNYWGKKQTYKRLVRNLINRIKRRSSIILANITK